MGVAAIIVAAGRGTRAGGRVPKQYAMLSGEAVLAVSIKSFLNSNRIDYLLVVINEQDTKLYFDCTKKINDRRLMPYCLGGKERSDSVKNGLKALSNIQPQKVLIHDAARPFVSVSLIESIIDELSKTDAVLPALPVFDAVWQIHETKDNVKSIKPGPNRSELLLAQTPQGFIYKRICYAHSEVTESMLDDIGVAHQAKLRISYIQGEETNFKITTSQQVTRVKRGY